MRISRKYARAAGMLVTLVVVGSGSLFAQDNPGDRAQDVQRAAQGLNPGSTARVRTEIETVHGRFSGTSAEGVILVRDGGGATPIPFTTIEEMWKQGRSTGTGALIGAGVGAVVVGGFGIYLVRALCETGDGCRDDQRGIAVVGGAIGALGGGLIGAGIGALAKRWVRIYP